jgi:hypothetical protein
MKGIKVIIAIMNKYIVYTFLFFLIFFPFKSFTQNTEKIIPPFYYVGIQLEYNYFTSNQFLIGANFIGLLKRKPKIILSYDAGITKIFNKNNNEIGVKLGVGLTYDSKLIVFSALVGVITNKHYTPV